MIAYPLDITYDGKELCQREMEGRDQLVISQFIDASKETGFYVCFGDMTKTVEGYAEADDDYGGGTRYMDDVQSETWSLDRIVDMNGVEPYKGVTLSFAEDNIIHKDLFEDQAPDEQDYDSYHGNLTHTFRCSVSSQIVKIC